VSNSRIRGTCFPLEKKEKEKKERERLKKKREKEKNDDSPWSL